MLWDWTVFSGNKGVFVFGLLQLFNLVLGQDQILKLLNTTGAITFTQKSFQNEPGLLIVDKGGYKSSSQLGGTSLISL